MTATWINQVPDDNDDFPVESLGGLSWRVVKRGEYPEGRKSTCCGERVVKNEVVVTVPVVREDECIGTAVLHRKCIADFLDTVPLDRFEYRRKFEQLREQIVKDGTPFPRKSTTKKSRRSSRRT